MEMRTQLPWFRVGRQTILFHCDSSLFLTQAYFSRDKSSFEDASAFFGTQRMTLYASTLHKRARVPFQKIDCRGRHRSAL